jgi:hypothetical protein
MALHATPSSDYLSAVQTTTEQRMALGGHRLADLLTMLFASNPIRLGVVIRTNGTFGFFWNAVSDKTYHVQRKQQLGDVIWNDLTNIIASSDSASFSEPLGQTWRFYRVVQ